MADISWFPYDVEEWDRRVREWGLSAEQEGFLMRAVRVAWRADEPCTIIDTPDELARALGAQWRKALPLIREHFPDVLDGTKRRRCMWLLDDFQRAVEKHESYQRRGKMGGRPRKAEDNAQLKAQLKPQLSPQPAAGDSQSSTEGNSSPPSEERAIPPADASAPAPVGATPRVASNGDYLDRPSTREALARAGVRPHDVADSPRAPVPLTLQAEQLAEQQLVYGAVLRDAVNDWLDEHPGDAEGLHHKAAVAFGSSSWDAVPLQRLTAARGYLEELVRQHAKWPSERTWDGRPFGEHVPA